MNRTDLEKVLKEPVFLANEEVDFLSDLFADRAVMVEIGTAFGASAALMLRASPDGMVTSIDPFVPDSHGDWQATPQRAAGAVRNALTAWDMLDRLSHWTLWATTSQVAAGEWCTLIDLLFIDGDHHYEAVRRDFEDWYPFVRPGGLIVLHDSRRLPGTPKDQYAQGWPGPTQLALELSSDPRVAAYAMAYSLTVWRSNWS